MALGREWTEGTFESLLESAPDAMVIVDKTGSIRLVNSQTEHVFGYPRAELIGQKIEILLPERYRTKHIGQRDGYFSAPRVRPMGAGLDLYGLRKDGSEMPIEISLSPLRTPQGLLVISAIRDISDRKRIEKELKSARAAADAANRAKSEFLANMSHEIRTPLAGILGYAEMLINYCKTDEERKDYGAKIKRNADNLTELINDILDLSKVEAGALKVEQLKFSPTMEVDGVLSLLEVQAQEKGISLESVFERPIPEQIVTDPKRFRQVLINVLGNAIKFTDKGRVTVRMRMDRAKKEPLLEIAVTDSGCGIPLEAQSQLFRPFVQADSSTTRKYGGTGLGLVLSRRLSRAMGGDLVLSESAPGKGSTFIITVETGSAEQLRSAPALDVPVTTRQAEQPLKGVRVLLAEDHEDNEELITSFLRRSGAGVEVARNGAEAVALVRTEPFDIVLMDIQMPVMDGCAALKTLRGESYTLPIVAVTAHAMLEEREKCMNAGFSHFLTKPLDFNALIATIEGLVPKKK